MNKSYPVLMVAACALTAFATPNAVHAQGILDRLFGISNEESLQPPPEKTLQAPFPTDKSAASTTPSNSTLMAIYDSAESDAVREEDLSKPHRNEQQITEWATGVVAQALTITPKSYDADFKKIAPHFTPYALQEYQAYLAKTDLMNVLAGRGYRLQSMADMPGSVIKDGEISGTYHWLIHVPLMSSFYNQDAQGVEKAETIESNHVLVQVQVGRVKPQNADDIGLMVERWSVSSAAAN